MSQFLKKYPFLAKIKANPEDLEPSLLKKLADAINADPEFTRDVTIDGFTKAVHVDASRRDLLVSKTHLYTQKNYGATFFHASSGKTPVDHSKLAKERKQDVKAMKSEKDQPEGESGARKLTITTGRKK